MAGEEKELLCNQPSPPMYLGKHRGSGKSVLPTASTVPLPNTRYSFVCVLARNGNLGEH